MFKVLVDPGHGGTDPGATYKKIHEADLNLELSNLLTTELDKLGITINQTRINDTFISLIDRVKMQKSYKPNLFVSVHCNSFMDSKVRGFEVLFYSPASKGCLVAKEIIKDISTNPKFVLHGSGLVVRNDLYVLKSTTCPAILIENFFVSNAADRKILNSLVDKTLLMKTIANAVWNICRQI